MGQLVLVAKAAEESKYTTAHIRLLLRKELIQGEKQGGTWLVDLDSLKAYEAEMDEVGAKKYDPTQSGKLQ